MAQSYDKGFVTGDFVIRETDPVYTREEKELTNDSGDGTQWTFEAGHPMDDNIGCEAADIANCDGLLLEKIVLEDGETAKVAVIARGEVVINRDALPTTDYLGASINMANFATALAALGFIVRREPTNQAEHTT